MTIRKITLIMLIILFILIAMIARQYSINNKKEVTNLNKQDEVDTFDTEYQGDAIDKNNDDEENDEIIINGFEYLTKAFSSDKDANECMLLIIRELHYYKTPTKSFEVALPNATDGKLVFKLVPSKGEATEDEYVVSVSASGTAIERVK